MPEGFSKYYILYTINIIYLLGYNRFFKVAIIDLYRFYIY